jgi:serine/threonine protein phosphatase PrpC
MSFKFQFACDQGAVRSNNEDAIKFGSIKATGNNDEIAWMIIADGMGGHQAGEVASKIIVDEVEKTIGSGADFLSADWLCWIEITLNKANQQIFQQAKKNQLQKGMGSTAVLVIVDNNQCYIGWVGDSRCYIYSEKNEKNEKLEQLTIDHTMVQLLLDRGSITKTEAKTSNNKNMLSKAIGVKLGVKIDTKQHTIHNNDLLLLSTDGLHDSLSHKSLENFVKQATTGIDISEPIIKQAIEDGSRDNITFGSILINFSS